jgi:hypothetical protein
LAGSGSARILRGRARARRGLLRHPAESHANPTHRRQRLRDSPVVFVAHAPRSNRVIARIGVTLRLEIPR